MNGTRLARGILIGAAAIAMVAASASADNLCTLVKGVRGWCKDNGCAKSGANMFCVPEKVGRLVVDCHCRKRGGRASMSGANLEMPGGSYQFDGTVIFFPPMPVGDIYDFDTGAQDPFDPAVGAVLVLPPLQFGGLKRFDDGEFGFDYYAFENVGGAPLEVQMRDQPLFGAEFQELAYIPSSNAWGLFIDTDRFYNNIVGSPALQKIEQIDQSDQRVAPAIVLASADDAFQQTNGFTSPHGGQLAPSSFGLDIQFWCPGDWNDDGDVNTLDVLAFLNDWTSDDPIADLNGDGEVNTLDVLEFLNSWSEGCP